MKLTITINMGDGSEPVADAKVIDVPATEVFPAPPRLALPRPRAWWRSKKPNMLDGAVVAGAVAGALWWLS